MWFQMIWNYDILSNHKKGVVNVAAGLITAFIFFFLYVGSFNTDYLFNTHIHGLAGLKVCSSCWNQACDLNNDLKGGVFVALKQTRGEDNVLFGIKLKQIPMIYLFAACLLVLAGLGEFVAKVEYVFLMVVSPEFRMGQFRDVDHQENASHFKKLAISKIFLVSLPYFVLLSSGVMSAWIYLRFYQRHSRGRGDLADHFSFASFFPRVFRVSRKMISKNLRTKTAVITFSYRDPSDSLLK